MSLHGLPFPEVPIDERLAALRDKGRCIDLADIEGGEALHTGFGYGPEFWQMPPGLRATEAAINYGRAEVVGARLITTDGKPISKPDALIARGVKISLRIPQI